jgi:hypothetical protein
LSKDAIEYDAIYRMQELRSCGFNVEEKKENEDGNEL